MVVAVQTGEPITAIIPARPSSSSSRNGSHGRPADEPVLEIKQKSSSRHEKRTKRDYYRHSGDGKQPPIEYVYTYSEETPKPGSSSDPNGARNSNGTLTDLVPVNGNGPSGKIECTLGEDGNLVVKIRGKPDSVPLDPSNLPIKLPDGWQLKEIQTNQRSRKTERSRKTRIKDEVLVEDEANENAVVVYNEHTLPVNGEMGVHETDQEQFGHADEEEYVHGERDGLTFVQKKSKKYEQGPAGLTSRIEESRSEEGIDFDHPNNKQRSSRNLHSLMERTENAKRKFSKQSVTDEKVTEKHTSNVMYFDGNSSSAGGPAENLRDDRRQTSARNEYSSRSDVRGRGDHHQQHNHDIIVESPDDTPYNSLDRRHHRHQQHQEEIVNVDDRYRYHNGDRVGDAAANYDSSNYSTLDRSQRRHETDVTETDRELYREDLFGPGGTHRYHPPRQERTDHTTEREVLREDIYGPGGKSRYPEPPSSYGDERSERVSERELYREDIYGPDGKRRLPGTGSVTDRTDQTTERELLREDIFGPDGKRRSPRGRDLDERSEQTIEKELYREDIYDPDGRRLPGTGSVNERTDQTTEREFSREDLYGPDGKRRSPRGRDLDDRSEQTTERELFREDIYGPNGGRRIPERSGLNERTDQTVEKNVYRESIYGPSPLPGTNFRPSSLIPTVRDDSLYQRSDTRNSNLTDLTDIRNANSRQGNYNDTNVETSTTQRTDITEKYRNGVEVASRPIQNAHRQETFSENLERTSVAGSYPRHPHFGSRDTVVENTERTDTAEHFVVQPGASHQQPLARPSDSRQTEKSENVTITEHRRNKSPPGTLYTEVEFLNDHKPREQVTERSERTDVSKIYHSEVPVKGRQPSGQNPKSSSYSELRRVDRAEDLRETSSLIDHRTDIRENFEGPIKASQPTSSTNRIDNTERVEEFRSSQTFQSGQSGPVQPARGTDADTERSTKRTDATSMVTTSEITVNGVKSPSPPPLGQTEQRVKGNKERVTIDDRYRVVGRSDEQQQPRPQTFYSGTDQQTTGQSNVKTEEAYRRQTDSVRDSNYNQHVVTEKEKQHRSHSRLTEASSTGERIVPIGGSGVVPESLIPPFSRQSSRLSSVDLSEIKAADHLDNQVLKDRGNLAQNGSMGQRRPPTRNPVKYHFGDENGPDDVLSNSDTTLPTHFGGAPFRPTVTAPRGQSVASSDLYVDRGAYDRTNKSTVTQQQSQQRTMRDDRVLINYTDTSTKPDWVSNIDQHFSGQRNVHHNIHYARENVTSPTPRIEEIVTIPGSTVITVNGEHEPVHGIVTEPGDRPLLPVAHPIERDVVHQSEKGSKYGFTRVTESKGFKQSAKEKVQYQERQENTRQISVSYSVPGRGKETREYTWDGIHEQPEEKITFQEDREHRKDVSLTLGLDSLQPRLPQRPTSTTTERTQTTDLKEKIVFAETREPQQREVSVNLSLQTDRQKQEISARHPIESNTFHFEEAVNRERSVNLVVGLDQDQQRLENIHERKETHRSARHEHKELYDVRTQEVQDIEYYEPIPKVTFQEEREVKKDVSFTLGLEDYEAAQPFEPIPVEKITFEETREIVTDHDVAVVFGLDTPAPVHVQSPRPVSVMSESTIKTRDTIQTREIVPQVTKVREEIKKVETIEQIIQESRVDTRVVVTPPPPPSPPSGVVIARTEIIPPLPRKTSISAAIESAAIHHNEVDLAKPSDSTRIFETSVEKEAKEHRERAEQKIQVQPPPPIPLPPTSGRVEKHVHLENLIPEPTGEHLPESLLTTGFVYTATLEPKRPDLDQTIDFHVHPPAVPETVERVETLQWYVKEGKPPSEIPDDESITTVGELRSATPPYHGELTATAQITPPTRVTATTEITPPVQKPKVVKESPTVRAEVCVVPPPPPQKPKPRPKEPVIEPLIPAPSKQFYFGEDEEDRLSVHSGHSWEEVVPQTPRVVPPPVKPARAVPEPPVSRVNQLSRRPGAEAQPTHHSELQFATREEEELWKTSLERHALPSRKRTEQSLQLERTEEPQRPVPKPSGRIPKKTWSEKIDTENTSQRGAKVLGTYGFLYTATLNPQATVRGKPLDVDEWQMATTSSFTSVDLDVQQVLLSAFTDIEPALTPKQQHQLMIASMEIFPPLSEVQQQLLLDALVVINLTVDQQRQLLTGCEIIPPLTHRQQQQLMTASAEIIPGFTPKQEKRLFYASLQVDPPLTPDQQQQLLFAVSEIFPPSSGPRTRRRTLKEIEEMTRSVEEEEDEMETVYKYGRKRPEETVGRINRRGEWERTTVESESRESAAVDIINRRKEEYEQATRKDERWREDTTRTDEHWREGISTSHNRPQQQHRSERHVGHGKHTSRREFYINAAGASATATPIRISEQTTENTQRRSVSPCSSKGERGDGSSSKYDDSLNSPDGSSSEYEDSLNASSPPTIRIRTPSEWLPYGTLPSARLQPRTRSPSNFPGFHNRIVDIGTYASRLNRNPARYSQLTVKSDSESEMNDDHLSELSSNYEEEDFSLDQSNLRFLTPSPSIWDEKRLELSSRNHSYPEVNSFNGVVDFGTYTFRTHHNPSRYNELKPKGKSDAGSEEDEIIVHTRTTLSRVGDSTPSRTPTFNDYFTGSNQRPMSWQEVQQRAEKRRHERVKDEERRKAERAVFSPMYDGRSETPTHALLLGSPALTELSDWLQHRPMISTRYLQPRPPVPLQLNHKPLVPQHRAPRTAHRTLRTAPRMSRNYHRDKEVSLNQRKWLAEQSTYLEDEDQDLEVSAINMNVKPRIKSEILMAPSPPARSMSPAVRAGSRYTASPQMGTPPMTTEFSGFMYEAPVDGHGSPMSAEMGTYGFTYQATLDGSEPYRKQAEAHLGELEIYTESRKREEYSETPKTITNTPPRRSPWSTPPVTPTPVLATATPPPRGTTPLPPVKELVESRDSAWRKHEETSWGRSLYEKDIVGGRKEFPSLEVTLPVGATHRQEVRGRLDSPEEEVTERITENVIRRRTEQELTYEEQEMNRIAAEASSWLKRTDNKQVEHTGRNTTDPVNRGRPTQSDPRRDPVSHQQQETWETKSTSSFSTRQERVEHESRQGLGDRGPPSDVVHPPNTPFKCDYPLVEPPRPSRDRSRDRASSRDSSREDLERKTAEVIKRAEEMESLYEASTSSSTTNQQSTTNSTWTEKDPRKPRTERPRDSSVDRTKFDRSLEALDRKTTSVVNRVQEMAVAYGTNQNELTTTTTQQQHGPGWSGTRDPAVRDSDVLKRVHEMESEQKTSAAIKRQKDLEAEEQARREREEVERKTASVVKRVKEMEDEQQRIRRLKEQEFSSRQVPESAPEPERRLGMGPDRVIETTMRRTQHREVHFEDQITATVDPTGSNPPESESQPDWIRLVEERKRRQEPLQQYFRPEKYAKKDTPRQLAELPEEDPLDAALERIGERKRQAMKGSPDGSPSSLRKWGNVGALSASASPLPTTSKDDSSFNKGFRRHTTETKEVIEESRFHSEEAMLEALESGDSNLISTMSQSLPSLALMKLMENTPSGQLDRALKDAVSMEELRKTSTKVKRTDGAEEEVREESFARRGDTVSPETKRTKRTVVRKLDKNGEWKEVAVREEDIPMDGDLLGPPVDLPIERVIAGMKSPEDDEWSLSDAVIEETTTTRTIRRVEEEEEDIISIAGTDA
ncbi:hypothetical protein BV898_00864 [Hypsibius exemplaris]|uniref:Uncharacterized protein n=1 Tax=Hypsibius exemplaris TaxID=2072580 RepID=A0A1W0XCG2_HYPEX|nr:hypothetical protein BV898_00864 [Hypsibius exemplaris]